METLFKELSNNMATDTCCIGIIQQIRGPSLNVIAPVQNVGLGREDEGLTFPESPSFHLMLFLTPKDLGTDVFKRGEVRTSVSSLPHTVVFK